MTNLIEECRKININQMIREVRSELLLIKLKAKVESLDQELQITSTPCHFGGQRYWFQCPVCGNRVGVMYKHAFNPVVACRKCLNLDYRKHRYKGMIEGQ